METVHTQPTNNDDSQFEEITAHLLPSEDKDSKSLRFSSILTSCQLYTTFAFYATYPLLLFAPSLSARLHSPFAHPYSDYAATLLEGLLVLLLLVHVLLRPLGTLGRRFRVAWVIFPPLFFGASALFAGIVAMEYHYQRLVGKTVGIDEAGIFLTSWDRMPKGSGGGEMMSPIFRRNVLTVLGSFYGALLGYVLICSFMSRAVLPLTDWMPRKEDSAYSRVAEEDLEKATPTDRESPGSGSNTAIRKIVMAYAFVMFLIAVAGKGYSPISNVAISTIEYLWSSGDSILDDIHYKKVQAGRFRPNVDVRPNFILIEMESLSRERLYSERGHESAPRYFQFLKNHSSDIFEFPFAHSTAALTATAVPSMMTGRTLVSPSEEHQKEYLALPGLGTYAKRENYTTAVFSTSDVLLEAKGWSAIRSTYQHDFDIVRSPDQEPLKGHVTLAMEFAMDDRELLQHFINTTANDKRFTENPVMMLLVFNHLHHPYLVDDDKYEDPEDPTEENVDLARYHWGLKNIFDPNFEKVMEHIDKTFPGGLANTVIGFTGDHGERRDRAWNVSIPAISTPVWLHVPKGIVPESDRQILRANENKTVSNMDIFPTFVDILGYGKVDLRTPNDITVNGTSLLNPLPDDRVVLGWHALPYIEFNQILIINKGKETLTVDMTRKRLELYDLSIGRPSQGVPKNWEGLDAKEKVLWLKEPRKNKYIVQKMRDMWPEFLDLIEQLEKSV